MHSILTSLSQVLSPVTTPKAVGQLFGAQSCLLGVLHPPLHLTLILRVLHNECTVLFLLHVLLLHVPPSQFLAILLIAAGSSLFDDGSP